MATTRPEAGSADAPYFQVTRQREGVPTRGLASCSLGHKLAPAASGVPDGIYAEWHWNGRRLTIENDRYGMFPLFYAASDSAFSVSSSMFQLLAEGVPAEIDWAALAVFLRIGFYIGEDTPFKAIRLLPPGARLEWEDGRLDIRARGYQLAKPQSLSRRAAIDAYIALFGAAIRKRLPTNDDFTVPLSGGRDSRHILLELCAQGRRPKFCITGRRFPPARGEDEATARIVAEALGIEHVVVGPPASEFRSMLAANLRTSLTVPRRAWKLAIAEYLEGRVTTSYDGIGGDMLSAGATLNARQLALIEAGQLEQYCRSLFGNADAALTRLLPKHAYQRMSIEVAIAHVLGEVSKHLHAPNPHTSFNFWNRTRRFNATSPYGVYSRFTVYAPFLDHDLFDVLTSLPAEMMLDHQLHDETLRAAYPKHATLPFETGGRPSPPARRHTLTTFRELTAYVMAERPRHLLDRSYAVPRLGVALASLGSWSPAPWFVSTVAYLAQLESIAYADRPSFASSPAAPYAQSATTAKRFSTP